MAELVFWSGTMDCGKSTLALQIDHNHRARGRRGLIFTRLDRAGDHVLSSRLGLSTAANEVPEDLDLWDTVVDQLTAGDRIDYLLCDEVQFYTPAQVEQLAQIVDDLDECIEPVGAVDDDVDGILRRVGSRRGAAIGVPCLVEGHRGGVIPVDGADEAVTVVPP